MASNRISDRAELRVVRVAFPAPQRERLHLAKAEWRIDEVEADRQIRSATLGSSCFVADEITAATDGPLGPGDDDAPGRVEMFLQVLAPVRSAADMGVPPDRESLSFQCGNERL